MSELTGQLLGNRYRVGRFLGRGGMADVYQVLDQQRAVPLAMKILHDDLAEDILFLQRFEREARALQILQHPNIVRFYGLEQAGGVAFILMDFIDGLTLRKEIFLHQQGLEPERILEIMQPVCAALFYAHQMGLVHCDLKPANIMIHRNGTVYLTDFGIARMTEASTASLSGVGTPAYMAPEQLENNEYSPAVDIYALGVVLYEMLTGGRRPFTGDAAHTTGSITKKISWEKSHLAPPSPRQFNPKISTALEAVVMRCLDTQPARRYASALDLLRALEVAVRGEVVNETDQTSTGPHHRPAEAIKGALNNLFSEYHLKPGLSRSPTFVNNVVAGVIRYNLAGWVAAGMGTIILLSIGLALFIKPVKPPAPAKAALVAGISQGEASSTPTPRATSTAAAVKIQPSATIEPLPTLTPSPQPTLMGGSQWIAFASDRGGSVQIWIMDAANPDKRRQLTKEQGGACQPAWSPDGTQVAFTTPCYGPSVYYPASMIKVVTVADLSITDLQLKGAGAFDPAWSPDGSELAFTAISGETTEIRTYNFSNKTVRTLIGRGSKNAQPAWSPDGYHIAFITSDIRRKDALWLMRKAGDSQEVLNETTTFANPAFSPNGSQILITKNQGNNFMQLVLVNRFDATHGEQRLLEESYQSMQGSFSPDGRWVVFWSDMAKNSSEILLASIDGKEIRQLTNNKLRDFQPAWSPR